MTDDVRIFVRPSATVDHRETRYHVDIGVDGQVYVLAERRQTPHIPFAELEAVMPHLQRVARQLLERAKGPEGGEG